jgi:Uma2 family endonuclease
VLSPSTRHIDAAAKLAGYFRRAIVAHYLIFDPERPVVVHHARGTGDAILTRIVRDGVLRLDPPGFDIDVTSLFERTFASD